MTDIKSAIEGLNELSTMYGHKWIRDDCELAICSLKAWGKVLTELENMRDIVWQDTDDEQRIVRANAWDKNEILVKAIDIINQHLEIEEGEEYE